MCMIVNSTLMGKDTVLDCLEYDGVFMGSKVLKIFDRDNNIFCTSNFVVEKSRNCFGNGGTPWVMIRDAVPNNFTVKGNTILFE